MNVAVNSAELHYTTRGAGPVCLVLSSIGTKPYELQMSEQLSRHLRLVFVDLRGSGRSTGDPADLTFDVLAEDLEAVRADVGAERVAVLGHSILGSLAIEYGRRRPGSVSHVITAGATPRGDMAWLAAQAAEFFEKDASEERKQILRDNLAGISPGRTGLLAETPKRFFDPRFDAAPLFAEAVYNPAFFQHLLGPLTNGWDVTAGSDSLRVPMFLAHGRYDYVVPHNLWDGITGTLSGATFRLFERSGHQPFFEEPDEFVVAVMEWMDRVDQTGVGPEDLWRGRASIFRREALEEYATGHQGSGGLLRLPFRWIRVASWLIVFSALAALLLVASGKAGSALEALFPVLRRLAGETGG
jgi:proline iminopeptidase